MSPETALRTLQIIAAIGAGVWLCGLAVLYAVSRPARADQEELEGIFDATDPDESRGDLAGEATVAGSPEELSVAAARYIAREMPASTFLIREQSPQRLVIEPSDEPGLVRRGRQAFRRVTITFKGLGGGQTRVGYRAQGTRLTWLLVLGWAFQVLGLAVLVGLYWFLRTYVVPNPDPQIRVQVFQMVQAVHVLWPPFLFAGLSGSRRRFMRSQLDVLIHNLPYLDGADAEAASSPRRVAL